MSVMLETRDALAELVEGLYSPTGEQEAMLFKSSGELAYEFREMVECTALDVTVVMKKLGYKFQKFDGVVNWVVYDRYGCLNLQLIMKKSECEIISGLE